MYLIVGATGSLGGSVAKALLQCGHKVRAVVRPSSPLRNVGRFTDPDELRQLGAELVEGDLGARLSVAAPGAAARRWTRGQSRGRRCTAQARLARTNRDHERSRSMPTAVFTRKVHEYDDVYTFWFHQPDLRYRAGMYAHLQLGSFFSRDGMRELSIASAPHEDELAFVAHIDTGSGFKRRLHALQSGDPVKLYGIAGHIGLPKTPERGIQFIAGGVGMAPFRSLILTAARRGGYRMRLLQVQRGDDYLYQDELGPLVAEHIRVGPDAFLEQVRAAAHDQPDALFYICGSKRLVAGVRHELAGAGIRRRNLRIENFR